MHLPYEKYQTPSGEFVRPGDITDAQRRQVRGGNMEDEHAAPAFTGFAEATKGLFHIKAVPVGTVIPLTDILGMDPGENNIAATSDGKAVSKEEFYAWRKPGKAKASNVSDYGRLMKGKRAANRRLAKTAIEHVQNVLSTASLKTHDYERFMARRETPSLTNTPRPLRSTTGPGHRRTYVFARQYASSAVCRACLSS